MRITSVKPKLALPGGVIRIEVEGLTNPAEVEISIGGERATPVAASPSRLTVRVPESPLGGRVEIVSGEEHDVAEITVGHLLVTDLHAVGNPVVDSAGRIYVTFSGTRGEKVPFSVFVIASDGTKEPFLAEIMNPTGLAIGPDQCLYITSRNTGIAYRSTLDKRVEKYADGLGLATGLAFDSAGNLFVGDRGGVVYKVAQDRSVSVFSELEPSISAYHFAMSADNQLYVSGPTLSTQDCIYKIDHNGEPHIVFRGLGRPQGMAFGPDGQLQIAASYRGTKGVFTLSNGGLEHTIAAPMMVGLAYSSDHSKLFLANNNSLFELPV